MTTSSQKTLRRHRGREIRKRRRLERQMSPLGLLTLDYVDAIWAWIREAARPAVEFVMVAAARATPHPFPSRDGAGARRQLLANGRGQKGRR